MSGADDATAPESQGPTGWLRPVRLLLATDSGRTVLSSGPALGVYRISSSGRRQTGVIADALVEACSSGSLRGHEQTRADREQALIADLDDVEALVGPAVLAHRPAPGLAAALDRLAAGAPSARWLSADGARHDVWLIGGEQLNWLQSACALLDPLYIIDGHHRIAAAARKDEIRRRAGGTGSSGRFLAAVFPTDELAVHAYHRVVDLSGGPSRDQLLDQLSQRFDVTPADGLDDARPTAPGAFGLGLDGRWHRLRPRRPAAGAARQTDVAGQTDVELLEELVLRPLIGIADARRDERTAFVPDVDDPQALIEAASRPDRACFLVHPLTMDDVLAVADAGRALPPKSTWFDPKPITGAVLPAERLPIGAAEPAAPL